MFDLYYLILVVPALLFASWAQMQVSSTFDQYSKVRSSRGITAAQVARRILDANRLQQVRVERIAGKLTDHFDPSSGVIRLSDDVYGSSSVAAIGVAAHECGHAVQHAQKYAPMQLRAAIIPVTNLGSKLSIPLFVAGLILSYQPFCNIGLLLFSLAAIFQLVTLPVEFDASARALRTLEKERFLESSELRGSKRVLKAAALTYVAALVVSLAQLLRLVLISRSRNRD